MNPKSTKIGHSHIVCQKNFLNYITELSVRLYQINILIMFVKYFDVLLPKMKSKGIALANEGRSFLTTFRCSMEEKK